MSTHREDDASLALAAQILEQVFKIAVAGEEDERIVRVALKDCVNRNLDIKVRLSVRSIGCVVAVFFQRLRDEPEAKPVLKEGAELLMIFRREFRRVIVESARVAELFEEAFQILVIDAPA